jgi:hypothetical protein
MMPSISGKIDLQAWGVPAGLVDKATRSRTIGSAQTDREADYLQFWPHTEANRHSETGRALLKDDGAWKWHHDALKDVEKGGNTFANQLTISSLYYLFKARPQIWFQDIAPTPVRFLLRLEYRERY